MPTKFLITLVYLSIMLSASGDVVASKTQEAELKAMMEMAAQARPTAAEQECFDREERRQAEVKQKHEEAMKPFNEIKSEIRKVTRALERLNRVHDDAMVNDLLNNKMTTGMALKKIAEPADQGIKTVAAQKLRSFVFAQMNPETRKQWLLAKQQTMDELISIRDELEIESAEIAKRIVVPEAQKTPDCINAYYERIQSLGQN